MDYDIFEHRHRFACWAAARAAQRGFANTKVIVDALESTGIREFVRASTKRKITRAAFDKQHREWRTAFCRHARHALRAEPTKAKLVTHGRAAKVIAIYVKTMVITNGNHRSPLARVAHPPIDRVLLKALARDGRVEVTRSALRKLINWTQLGPRDYERLIEDLRKVTGADPFWMIEECWSATDESRS
jgi:hypothetical protein